MKYFSTQNPLIKSREDLYIKSHETIFLVRHQKRLTLYGRAYSSYVRSGFIFF